MIASVSPSVLQPSAVSMTDGLLMAVFFAVILHAFVLLGIGFSMPKVAKINKQIEISFATVAVKDAPKKARFLAQDNQIGSGSKTKKPTPKQLKQRSLGRYQNKPPKPEVSEVKSQPKAIQKIVTQVEAEEQIATSIQIENTVKKIRPKLSAKALQQQISQLGAKIRYSQQSSDLNEIKFVNSISTHKYMAAQYVIDWEQKVERFGNLNFPANAIKKGFSSALVTDVGINANGTIYSIRVTKSSGNKALDDAAKRIIRLSAPFAPLPKALLKQLKVLVITRVWKFSDESNTILR